MAVRSYTDARGRTRYAVEFEQQGRRIHRRCPPSTTQAQAKELEVRLRRELFDRTSLNHTPEVPLAAAIQLWLDSTLPHRKDKTVKSKAHQWAQFLSGQLLSNAPSVALRGIKTWTATGISAATVNRRLCVLKATAKWCYQQGMIAENLSPRIRLLPGEVRREVYLTAKEVERLAKHSPSYTTRASIMISAYTGLCVSELLALKSTPSTAQSLVLFNTKNGKARAIPIIDRVRSYLAVLPVGLTYRQLIGEFWLARERAKMPHVRWHDLRHSTASMLINAGVSLYVVGQILGHSSPNVTSRYAHLTHETLRAAMDKIGGQPSKNPTK